MNHTEIKTFLIDVKEKLMNHICMAKSADKTKSVFERVKERPKRIQVSLTFSGGVYEEFQEMCEKEGVAVSRVLEILMTDLIESKKK